MFKKVKEKLGNVRTQLMVAYSTGLCFIANTCTAHASIGDKMKTPVNTVGNEVESMLMPGAVIIVVICGVLLIMGKKKAAGTVLVGAICGYFIIKNRTTLGNIFSGFF